MQKSADLTQPKDLPIEVLYPKVAAQQYSARMLAPSAALVPWVAHHWVLSWDLRGKPPFTCEVIPSPSVNLTFMREGARITGVATGKYSYQLAEQGMIFGTQFKPGGFRPFWRKRVQLLSDTTMPARGVFPGADELNASLPAVPHVEAMQTRVEQLLIDQRPNPDKKLDLIAEIFDALESDRSHTVQSVALRFSLSERALQALFHDYVGVGLKWVMLRLRLQRAAALAAQTQSPCWAAIAADLGYTDQAHFVNDFKRIIGTPPGQYAAVQSRA